MDMEPMSCGEVHLAFDPLIPVADTLKKWWAAILVALAAGLLAFAHTSGIHCPQYTARCTVAVYGEAASTELAVAFAEVIGSPVVRGIGELEKFGGSIRASVLDRTNLVTLNVTADSPEEALAALELLLARHDAVTEPVTGGLVLEYVEQPWVSEQEDSPADPFGAAVRAMLAGAAGVFAGFLLLYWFRDVVRGPEEAERKLRCPYLGSVCRRSGVRQRAELEKLCRRVEVALGSEGRLLVTEPRPGDGGGELAEKLREMGLPAELLPLSGAMERQDRAEGILLVLRHDSTPARLVNRAAEALGQGRLLGCVLVGHWSTGLFDGGARAAAWYKEAEK